MKRFSELKRYQHRMTELGVTLPGLLLAADMGLGKTVSTLGAVDMLLEVGEVERVLIVAPLRVAENTWPDEIREWEHLAHLKFSVLTGSPSERAAAAASSAPIHIINRENVRWLFDFWGKNWPYDMLVYDESSRLKAGKKRTPGREGGFVKALEPAEYPESPSEQAMRIFAELLEEPLTKTEVCERADVGVLHVEKLIAAGALAPVDRPRPPRPPQLTEFGALALARPKIARVIELTGTPAPGGLEDLWGQAYIIDQGERLGKTKTAFLQRWFRKGMNGFDNIPLPHAEAEIMAALGDIMFSMKEADYREVIPVAHNCIYVDLPKKSQAEYKKFKRELYSEEYDVEAVNKGVLTGKLLQFANGSMYRQIDENTRETVAVHDAKLPALESIIEEAAGAPVLLGYSFQFDLERLKKRFPHAIVFDEDPNFISRWNRREISLGLAHPASIGHGLNLQYGGNILVWYGLTWSLELYQQFNKRLPRPGQDKTVFIHHILARGTEDERVYRTLNEAGVTQDRINDLVKLSQAA